MSRLENAISQFNQALDRLDAALARRGAASAGAGSSGASEKILREIQALREDRARLAEALDSARADYAALESVGDEVEERLDGAIRDIRRVLGSA
jgi:predicted  nucleic acid-binding Zn-ribbon protein